MQPALRGESMNETRVVLRNHEDVHECNADMKMEMAFPKELVNSGDHGLLIY